MAARSNPSYEDQVRALAESVGSTGSDCVYTCHQVCCHEHDWAYVTRTTPQGVPTSKAEADERFRQCLRQQRSWARRFIAWLGFGPRAQIITKQSVAMVTALVNTPPAEHALAEARWRRIEILSTYPPTAEKPEDQP